MYVLIFNLCWLGGVTSLLAAHYFPITHIKSNISHWTINLLVCGFCSCWLVCNLHAKLSLSDYLWSLSPPAPTCLIIFLIIWLLLSAYLSALHCLQRCGCDWSHLAQSSITLLLHLNPSLSNQSHQIVLLAEWSYCSSSLVFTRCSLLKISSVFFSVWDDPCFFSPLLQQDLLLCTTTDPVYIYLCLQYPACCLSLPQTHLFAPQLTFAVSWTCQ